MSAGPIRRLTSVSALPPELRGAVVAIGNFDGVHRGHQAVLERADEIARREGRPLVCLTFEPHPRTVFRPQDPVPRLTPAPMKARLLAALGFEAVIEQPFSRDFAGLSADSFLGDILVGGLGLMHVVVGFDFHYGARRAGTPALLREAGARLGFGVTCVEAFTDEGGETVSSSRIRAHLAAGEVAEAAGLLGYRWTVEAEVTGGQRLGRTLGYPTANMRLHEEATLGHGIYAVRFRRADGRLHDGVASYGRRPTFDNGAPLFETHLFDFSGDLYGETAEVSLFGFLRPEEKFDGAEALVRQMDRDAEAARALLAAVRPLSALDDTIAFALGGDAATS
ncbi:bifunctional riboflavin kinase/FAD synthetase [Mangrovibrevibacter kandeliae]|uniref:bifunctional riboflavin kinase/FAD synthetase n=1 Tax=Mangrovibrevibacter kandeliae TaxID=2968473 RepID=UPI002119B5A7|nr:bifunctional riboflavin kinase/FAD synthetase [Aurantimonas sp. CSK15Z-1]MCQ8782059.1 bifunctional riboflavin kinase/FAD synthetase [Aurantimonas sp. CSK15Z-1]